MTEKPIFLQKRNDLEVFVKEQIVGPGAFNKRFFLLNKWVTNEFAGKNLKDVLAFDNTSEILAEVPAYQYSSAILFPISKQDSTSKSEGNMSDEKVEGNEEEEDDKGKTQDEDTEGSVDNTESISSKNQNYPNT